MKLAIKYALVMAIACLVSYVLGFASAVYDADQSLDLNTDTGIEAQ